MDYSELRRLSLRLFLAFLVLTALVAIVSLLGGKIGDTQGRILATTFTISCASICSMACAAFLDRRKGRGCGFLGILLSVVAAILVIVGVWGKLHSDEYWKTTGSAILGAAAMAHALLLLLPDLGEGRRWIQRASLYSIAVLTLQILVAIWAGVEEEAFYRLLGAVAVVVGLGTLSIPILARMRKRGAAGEKRLVLEQVEGDLYRDPSGRVYRVTERAGPGDPSGEPPPEG